MIKRYWWQISIIVILMGIVTALEYYSPQNKDWRETYSRRDKIPYGTYILWELLPDIFTQVQISEQSLYQQFGKNAPENSAYLSITQRFEPGEQGTEALYNYVSKGNQAFISARQFSKTFRERLEFDYAMGTYSPKQKDSVAMRFTNSPEKITRDFYFFRAFPYNTFREYDTGKTQVLSTKADGKPVMISIKAGKGTFFLHSTPQCFTNYNMLKKANHLYAAVALSRLSPEKLIWDGHYKPYKTAPQTPLRYILSVPALRMAYYVLITGALLLVVFHSKRMQRPIPVWQPPANHSLNYIKTIAHLYFRYRDDKRLAEKKLQHWREFLRTKFYTEPRQYTEEELNRIVEKTGVSKYTVQKLFESVREISGKNQITQNELLKLNRRIEQFHNQIKA